MAVNLSTDQMFPRLEEEVEGGRILVLAPHMDDDVIGCGGVLRLHVLAGAAVRVVYMTTGQVDDPLLKETGISGEERLRRAAKLRDTRMSEAVEALARLGIDDIVFLPLTECDMGMDRRTIEQIGDILEECEPEVIYAPYLLDPLPDHRVTCRLLAEALKQKRTRCKVRSYEVWTPLYANVLVPIDHVSDRKWDAIAAHESQTRKNDYIRSTEGLNRFRSIYYHRGAATVEAFMELPAYTYHRIALNYFRGRDFLRKSTSHRNGRRSGTVDTAP